MDLRLLSRLACMSRRLWSIMTSSWKSWARSHLPSLDKIYDRVKDCAYLVVLAQLDPVVVNSLAEVVRHGVALSAPRKLLVLHL